MFKLCKTFGEFKPGFNFQRIFSKLTSAPVIHVCREDWREYQEKRLRWPKKSVMLKEKG